MDACVNGENTGNNIFLYYFPVLQPAVFHNEFCSLWYYFLERLVNHDILKLVSVTNFVFITL